MSDFTGLITDEFKQLHEDMITELVEGCSVPCKLYFQGTSVDSISTSTNNIGNKFSGRLNSGTPSNYGLDNPYKDASQKKESQVSEDINLVVLWDSKDWIKISTIDRNVDRSNIKSSKGVIQTLSLLSTYDDIMEAAFLVPDTNLNIYSNNRYQRVGIPQPCGLGQATIVVTMWERI